MKHKQKFLAPLSTSSKYYAFEHSLFLMTVVTVKHAMRKITNQLYYILLNLNDSHLLLQHIMSFDEHITFDRVANSKLHALQTLRKSFSSDNSINQFCEEGTKK